MSVNRHDQHDLSESDIEDEEPIRHSRQSIAVADNRSQYAFSFFTKLITDEGKVAHRCNYCVSGQRSLSSNHISEICGKMLKASKSDGLIKHLRSHKDREINRRLNDYDNSLATAAFNKKRTHANEAFLPVKKSKGPMDRHVKHETRADVLEKESLEATAMCFAVNDLSLNLAASHYFHEMLEKYHIARAAGAIKKPHTVKAINKQQETSLVVMQELVRKHLQRTAVDTPVSLMLDGWQNINRIHVQSILANCKGKALLLTNDISSTGRSTADVLYSQLKPVIEQFIEDGIVVSCVIADNASVNRKMFRFIVEDFPFVIPIPCAAHTLQLCVVRLFHEDSRAESLRDVTRQVFKAIYNSQPLLARFRNSQEKPIHNLTKPQKTRWSSYFLAFSTLIKLRSAVMNVLDRHTLKDKLTDSFWTILQMFVNFLAPFRNATDIVQADKAGLLDVAYQFRVITRHLNAAPAEMAHAAEIMHRAVRRHWTKHVHQEAVFMSLKFSLENTEDSLTSDSVKSQAPVWFKEWGAKFLKQWKYPDSSIVELEKILSQQYGEFLSRDAPFEGFRGRMEEAREKAATTARLSRYSGNRATVQFDASKVWLHYNDLRPHLVFCVVTLFSINCSEASVERMFSQQKLTHSSLKNRKMRATVYRQMYLKWNAKAMGAHDDRISVSVPLDQAATDVPAEVEDFVSDGNETDTEIELFDTSDTESSDDDEHDHSDQVVARADVAEAVESENEYSAQAHRDPALRAANRRRRRKPLTQVLQQVQRTWTMQPVETPELTLFCQTYINKHALCLPLPFSHRGAARQLRLALEVAEDESVRREQPDVVQLYIVHLLMRQARETLAAASADDADDESME
jgi:hypothetical protein